MKICGIYKITSPTNRIYIGQSIDIKWRFSNYRRIDKGVKTSVKLYRSLKKYGSANHKFEIIEECTIDNLNERERYWQDFYNATSEEHLNCILTEETINKIKLARAKQIITEEHKRKISENSGSARIVLDFSTGVFYNSAKEVSDLYGIVANTLVNKLIGRNKNNTNFAYV